MSTQADFRDPTTISDLGRLPRPPTSRGTTTPLHTVFTGGTAPNSGPVRLQSLSEFGARALTAFDGGNNPDHPFSAIIAHLFTDGRWNLTPIGDIFRIRNRRTGRYLGNHSGVGFTTADPTVESGMWLMERPPGAPSTPAVLRHVGTGTVLDAVTKGPFEVTTGPPEQRSGKWRIRATANQSFTIQHDDTLEFLSATKTRNFKAIMQPFARADDGQHWDLEYLGAACTTQTWFDDRFLDAHVTSDFSVVTRTEQRNATQYWAMIERRPGAYTIQQVSNGRFLTAHPGRLTQGHPRVFTTSRPSEAWSCWDLLPRP